MNKKGFTLVEVLAILIVISIIGIIAMPNIKKTIETGDIQENKVEEQSLENAKKLYCAKYYADKLIEEKIVTFNECDLQKEGLISSCTNNKKTCSTSAVGMTEDEENAFVTVEQVINEINEINGKSNKIKEIVDKYNNIINNDADDESDYTVYINYDSEQCFMYNAERYCVVFYKITSNIDGDGYKEYHEKLKKWAETNEYGYITFRNTITIIHNIKMNN